MQSPTNYLVEKICVHFLETGTGEFNVNGYNNLINLVRVHNEKRLRNGDISFPCDISIWQNYFAKTGNKLTEETFAAFQKPDSAEKRVRRAEFLDAAAGWVYPLENIEVKNERCCVFLKRGAVIGQILQQVLDSSATVKYGQMAKNSQRRIYMPQQAGLCLDETDLSRYRARLIKGTLSRLLCYSEWTVETAPPLISQEGEVFQLQVLSIASEEYQKHYVDGQQSCVVIKCGIVTDPLNGKLVSLTTNDYLSLRSTDLRLMGMHKYGIRVKDDRRFCELIERLGVAAVTVDLLEVKHSSPVHIIRNGQGSTKGASFILYNSARLESLLRTFQTRVESEAYGQLPDMKDIDLTLLNEEEEWQLVFGYIFAFPRLIERCLENLERGSCATHLIVRFLSGFVSVFSVYYRRIRILTETRSQLMPIVYARIYLVKAIREILNKTLALLAIDPVVFM